VTLCLAKDCRGKSKEGGCKIGIEPWCKAFVPICGSYDLDDEVVLTNPASALDALGGLE